MNCTLPFRDFKVSWADVFFFLNDTCNRLSTSCLLRSCVDGVCSFFSGLPCKSNLNHNRYCHITITVWLPLSVYHNQSQYFSSVLLHFKNSARLPLSFATFKWDMRHRRIHCCINSLASPSQVQSKPKCLGHKFRFFCADLVWSYVVMTNDKTAALVLAVVLVLLLAAVCGCL